MFSAGVPATAIVSTGRSTATLLGGAPCRHDSRALRPRRAPGWSSVPWRATGLAHAGSTPSSCGRLFNGSTPSSVTTTMSSIRAPHRPGR
jgi:hypothetical protein